MSSVERGSDESARVTIDGAVARDNKTAAVPGDAAVPAWACHAATKDRSR